MKKLFLFFLILSLGQAKAEQILLGKVAIKAYPIDLSRLVSVSEGSVDPYSSGQATRVAKQKLSQIVGNDKVVDFSLKKPYFYINKTLKEVIATGYLPKSLHRVSEPTFRIFELSKFNLNSPNLKNACYGQIAAHVDSKSHELVLVIQVEVNSRSKDVSDDDDSYRRSTVRRAEIRRACSSEFIKKFQNYLNSSKSKMYLFGRVIV